MELTNVLLLESRHGYGHLSLGILKPQRIGQMVEKVGKRAANFVFRQKKLLSHCKFSDPFSLLCLETRATFADYWYMIVLL